MKPDDLEALNLSTSESEDLEQDPLVFAYRMGSLKSNSGIVQVRKSELKKNPKLFPLSKSAISKGFDQSKTLLTKHDEKLPANSYVHKKIQYRLMTDEISKRVKSENLDFSTLPEELEIKSMNDPAAQHILKLVTDQLKERGEWRDEDKDITMTEAFPLSQAQSDNRVSESKNSSEDLELSHDEQTTEGLVSELRAKTQLMRGPRLSTPMLHHLMRASPRDLYHQVARRLIDVSYFEDYPEEMDLFLPCFFASKGVEDEEHFLVLMKAGLEKIFPKYSFQEFQNLRPKLLKFLKRFVEDFFLHHPAICARLKLRSEIDKSDPKKVWTRFYKVWDALTSKQREALRAVYMDQDSLSKVEAAKKFGISPNSLKSRLKSAILKFKAEFHEFEGMTPKGLPRHHLKGNVTLNGLWRYESALLKSPLYRVDIKTGIKAEIDWKILPKSKNLDWKTIAQIKAEIIENCPIPYFHETEYFDDIKPTIISFDRKPGNFSNEAEALDKGFRQIE